MTVPVIPLILLVVGILIAFGSFVFAAFNMLNRGFGEEMFRNHIVAMIGMLIGGLITTVAMFVGGWSILTQIVEMLAS